MFVQKPMSLRINFVSFISLKNNKKQELNKNSLLPDKSTQITEDEDAAKNPILIVIFS